MRGADVIRAAQARAGYFRDTERLCNMIHIPLRTFNRRIANMDKMTIEEIRRIDKALHFTNDEIVELIKGKQ